MQRFLRNGFGHGLRLCPILPKDNETGVMVFHRQAPIVLGRLDFPTPLPGALDLSMVAAHQTSGAADSGSEARTDAGNHRLSALVRWRYGCICTCGYAKIFVSTVTKGQS
jgi:hypothetical protein